MNNAVRAARRLSGAYVPYLQPAWDKEDLAVARRWLKTGEPQEARQQLLRVLRTGFPDSAEIVLTDTGKSAIYVALKMLGVAPESEVIVPSYCCASIVAAVLRSGCIPVFADIDTSLNISAEGAAQAVSPRTGAILVPHLFGRKAVSLEAILDIGRNRNVPVIEDVAQAYGLRFDNGALAGTRSDAAIFSAGIGKPLMGPGGGWAVINRAAAATPNLEIEPIEEGKARLADFLRRFVGARPLRGAGEIAYSLRSRLALRRRRRGAIDLNAWAQEVCRVRGISSIDAFLAARQIERGDGDIERRHRYAERWRVLLGAARIPCAVPPDRDNSHAIMPLTFHRDDGERCCARFRGILEREGVATEPCYTPLHLREYGRVFRRTELPVTESFWRRVFAVPVRPNLSVADWKRIERAVARAATAFHS
jgi:dTDP-4-amino-4,6-dideoxygalactose transaminase